MLLAQFIGIVHEIRPEFLKGPPPEGSGRTKHLPPALVSLGKFSGNSRIIVDSFVSRGISVCIAENYDMRLAAHRNGTTESPLYWDDPASPENITVSNAFSLDDELDGIIQLPPAQSQGGSGDEPLGT
jgi:hypothetical protein